jgi:hypothetical protein
MAVMDLLSQNRNLKEQWSGGNSGNVQSYVAICSCNGWHHDMGDRNHDMGGRYCDVSGRDWDVGGRDWDVGGWDTDVGGRDRNMSSRSLHMCTAEAIFCCPTENSHHLKS